MNMFCLYRKFQTAVVYIDGQDGSYICHCIALVSNLHGSKLIYPARSSKSKIVTCITNTNRTIPGTKNTFYMPFNTVFAICWYIFTVKRFHGNIFAE